MVGKNGHSRTRKGAFTHSIRYTTLSPTTAVTTFPTNCQPSNGAPFLAALVAYPDQQTCHIRAGLTNVVASRLPFWEIHSFAVRYVTDICSSHMLKWRPRNLTVFLCLGSEFPKAENTSPRRGRNSLARHVSAGKATELQAKLWAYIAGIANNLKIKPLAVGGTANHMHVLIGLPATMPIAEAVQKLKANSSRWMSERGVDFEWQGGYGAFSVSPSLVSTVQTYIRNQEEHHKKRSFEEEFRLLLQKSGIAYDEESLFAA